METRISALLILVFTSISFVPSSFAQEQSVLTLDMSTNTLFYSLADDVIFYSYLVSASGGPTPGPISVSDDRLTVTCPAVSTTGNLDDTLDPGEEITCTATYTVVADDLTAGSITNVATASGNAGATVSNADTVTIQYLPPGTPLLSLVPAADPVAFTEVGQLINYTFEVTAVGNAPVIGPITVTNSRMTVSCPPVSSAGNGDQNLDVGESLVCTSSTITTNNDISLGYISTLSIASGSDATTSPTVEFTVPYEPPPSSVPTLSEWSSMLLSFLFLLMGVAYLRRKRVL